MRHEIADLVTASVLLIVVTAKFKEVRETEKQISSSKAKKEKYVQYLARLYIIRDSKLLSRK